MRLLVKPVVALSFVLLAACGGKEDPNNDSSSSSSSNGASSTSSTSSTSSSSGAAVSSCSDLRHTFETDVLPVLSGNACADCHNASGIASGTDFVLNLTASAETNYQAVYALFNAAGKNGGVLFVNKPTGREAHIGGAPIAIGSAEEAALVAYRDAAIASPGCDAPLQNNNALKLSDFSGEDVTQYLRMLAPRIVGRQLLLEELTLIEGSGSEALLPVLESWLTGDEAAEAARRFVSMQLNASGKTDEANFDLPGNLAAYLVKNNRPWSELLTANYCVGDNGEQIACDTGAPYNAGVLTTKGYLVNNSSRFNLRRATSLLSAFSCKTYPINDVLEPRVEKPRLIQMFQADSIDEVDDEQAQAGFGNGEACYSCHGQFAWHSQLFSKFDSGGQWHPGATGIQDPDGELGRSFNGLMASHFIDPAEAASEVSQMFGVAVTNLSDAAQVIVENDVYKDCTVRNMVMMAFGVDKSVALAIDNQKITALMNDIYGATPDPSLQDYLLHVLSDLEFVNNFVSHKSIALPDEIFEEIVGSSSGGDAAVDAPIDNKLYQAIQNVWQPDTYIHISNGAASAGPIQTNLVVTQWHFEASSAPGFYYIQSRADNTQYLHIENGVIESSSILKGWHSAQWQLVDVAPGEVQIRNRWKSDQYLHVERGVLESSAISQNWISARWRLR